MIEKTVILHLQAALNVPVYSQVPAEAPDSFVVIEKTGGGSENSICFSTVAAQSYAPSRLAAAELNESVKKAMEQLDDGNIVCRVELNADYHFTDTASKRDRYQAVFDITHY